MAKILIVDDEPRIRELIREHLQYAGYVCEEAGDGSAALSLLSGGGYDLVILDLMMPFMDGMTCLREMRNRHINTPVIILTARGEEYDKLAGLEGGADDYVVKPFSPRELVARVRAVLNRTMPHTESSDGTMTFGELTIDTASHTATKSIRVTVREKTASGHMNDNLNSAQTGDTTPLVLLAVIGVTAAVLCTAVVLVGRKQKTK